MTIHIPHAIITWSGRLGIFAAGFAAGFVVCLFIQGMLFQNALGRAFGWR